MKAKRRDAKRNRRRKRDRARNKRRGPGRPKGSRTRNRNPPKVGSRGPGRPSKFEAPLVALVEAATIARTFLEARFSNAESTDHGAADTVDVLGAALEMAREVAPHVFPAAGIPSGEPEGGSNEPREESGSPEIAAPVHSEPEPETAAPSEPERVADPEPA